MLFIFVAVACLVLQQLNSGPSGTYFWRWSELPSWCGSRRRYRKLEAKKKKTRSRKKRLEKYLGQRRSKLVFTDLAMGPYITAELAACFSSSG